MLNVGLIGNTEILEPFVKRLKENKNVNVIGKASFGSSSHLNNFHFSIPEFNKVELIERADVLILDNSLSMPFKILTDIVKKSKHVFTAEYMNLTIDECTQIVKLANESGSIVQVSNPYFFTPAVHWLNNHVSSPVYIDIQDFTNEKNHDNLLYSIILMLIELTGISPKKVGAVTFDSNTNKSDFSNVRLEFGDASVANISYGSLDSLAEFQLRVFSQNNFINMNFTRSTYVCNNSPIDLSDFEDVNEFDYFISTIQNKTKKKAALKII